MALHLDRAFDRAVFITGGLPGVQELLRKLPGYLCFSFPWQETFAKNCRASKAGEDPQRLFDSWSSGAAAKVYNVTSGHCNFNGRDLRC